MDEPLNAFDWYWLESETYRAGRENILRNVRSELKMFGVAAAGTVLSIEALQAADQLNSDAEPFVSLYPGLATLSCAAVALASIGGLINDAGRLRANNRWNH